MFVCGPLEMVWPQGDSFVSNLSKGNRGFKSLKSNKSHIQSISFKKALIWVLDFEYWVKLHPSTDPFLPEFIMQHTWNPCLPTRMEQVIDVKFQILRIVWHLRDFVNRMTCFISVLGLIFLYVSVIFVVFYLFIGFAGYSVGREE